MNSDKQNLSLTIISRDYTRSGQRDIILTRSENELVTTKNVVNGG